MASLKGWTVDPSYDSAADYVQDICDSLPFQISHDSQTSPGQWLMEGQTPTRDGRRELRAGIPLLCHRWTKTVDQALAGHYDYWYGAGTFTVGNHRSDQTIRPGTYRTVGKIRDCYWERTSSSGDIIANQNATAASHITVTIQPTDGSFTSQGECGVWKPVH